VRYVIRLLTVASILIAGNASAQRSERLPERVIVSEKAFASCYDSATQKLAGSMLVRSPILMSPDGNYEAYTENEAVAYRGETWADCVNTAKLLVKAAGEKEFRLAYLQEPHQYELFSQIDLVDWSPDSQYLLAELFTGQWGSDWGGTSPLLYNAWNGVFSPQGPQDFVSTALSNRFGHDCSYRVQSLGFAPDGGVVLKIQPWFDMEGILDPASCVKKDGLWILHNGLAPLADTYKVQRYGHPLQDVGTTRHGKESHPGGPVEERKTP
jgi:hypothetical protein